MEHITDLRTLQLEELKILKEFAEYCDDKGLRYYLAGGTLLGAVRHQGFIPWDDDVDVLMPRPDFERMLKETNGRLGEKYLVLYGSSYKTNVCAQAKIVNPGITISERVMQGTEQYLWIDVFPMDGMPDTKNDQEIHIDQLSKLSYQLWQSKAREHTTGNLKRLVKSVVFHRQIKKGSYFYADEMNRLAMRYPYEECDIIGAAIGKYGIRECIEKVQWEERIRMRFEDTMFYVSKGYDQYLSSLFGDYMKIPEEHHSHI